VDEIEHYEFALKHEPDIPLREVKECGCRGPLPGYSECRCTRHNRLIIEFLSIMKERKEN